MDKISAKKCPCGNICEYFNCGNSRRNSTVRMFRFPVKLKDICNQWILNSGNAKLAGVPVESLRGKYICRNHFNNEDFRTETQKYLKCNAVPQNYTAFFSSPFASDSEKTLKVQTPKRKYTAAVL
ncbi:uncharacterized protein LOC126746741 [Anthonomus grandis grandis]|uniref:uncharacterized protein LOC126746741 n=1 Tax=Anthonomus grandis grandis TaxID=2921223 RepID=UPI0021654664|nr:uncharacterized protein LOC126746741 [Anthonomus grandis grandis]